MTQSVGKTCFWVAMILWATAPGLAHAQHDWWKCRGGTDSRPKERKASADQERRLSDFGLGIFSPELPGYGAEFTTFSRTDLTRRFGPPLSTESTERRPRDTTEPVEILTNWQYRGFKIVTVASKSNPDALTVERGEAFDAKVPLRHGVRVGQPIDLWVRQFGRPGCRNGHLVYRGERRFACGRDKASTCVSTYRIELFLDGAGRVRLIAWDHPVL